MKYKAVIFDLGGTLVCPIPLQEYRRMLTQMASVLSISPDAFVQLWFETADERMKGIVKNYRDNIEYICRQVGVPVEDAKIELATQIRFDLVRSQLLVPRADAMEVLSSLKSEGYKVGLISDCSYEATLVWKITPFPSLIDVTVFSCLVGLTKPDPRIYQIAMEQLEVEPHTCLYIGDGGSQELTGASQIGMTPFLLRIPDDGSMNVYRGTDVEVDTWHGPVVSSLKEVLALLKE